MSNCHPSDEEIRHLPHEAWHVVQQRANRRHTTLNFSGAEFVGYPSPHNNTINRFPEWRITMSQGNWQDEIVPGNNPLHSPGLSGKFSVRVEVFCQEKGKFILWKDKQGNEIGSVECNENCNAMVIFYATDETGCAGEYYTVPNAVCS